MSDEMRAAVAFAAAAIFGSIGWSAWQASKGK